MDASAVVGAAVLEAVLTSVARGATIHILGLGDEDQPGVADIVREFTLEEKELRAGLDERRDAFVQRALQEGATEAEAMAELEVMLAMVERRAREVEGGELILAWAREQGQGVDGAGKETEYGAGQVTTDELRRIVDEVEAEIDREAEEEAMRGEPEINRQGAEKVVGGATYEGYQSEINRQAAGEAREAADAWSDWGVQEAGDRGGGELGAHDAIRAGTQHGVAGAWPVPEDVGWGRGGERNEDAVVSGKMSGDVGGKEGGLGLWRCQSRAQDRSGAEGVGHPGADVLWEPGIGGVGYMEEVDRSGWRAELDAWAYGGSGGEVVGEGVGTERAEDDTGARWVGGENERRWQGSEGGRTVRQHAREPGGGDDVAEREGGEGGRGRSGRGKVRVWEPGAWVQKWWQGLAVPAVVQQGGRRLGGTGRWVEGVMASGARVWGWRRGREGLRGRAGGGASGWVPSGWHSRRSETKHWRVDRQAAHTELMKCGTRQAQAGPVWKPADLLLRVQRCGFGGDGGERRMVFEDGGGDERVVQGAWEGGRFWSAVACRTEN